MKSFKFRAVAILAFAFLTFLLVKSDLLLPTSADENTPASIDITGGKELSGIDLKEQLTKFDDNTKELTITIQGYQTGDKVILPISSTITKKSTNTEGYYAVTLTSTSGGQDLQSYVDSMKFEPNAAINAERIITFSTRNVVGLTIDDVQHYYEYIKYTDDERDTDGTVDWKDAFDRAAGKSYKGLNGYLLTITSKDENAFVHSMVSESAWMGAADVQRVNNHYSLNLSTDTFLGPYVNDFGNWVWMNGPEKGTKFAEGYRELDGSIGTFKEVGGHYNNWTSANPSNSGGNEFVANIDGNHGQWNDWPARYKLIEGFVVEYSSNYGTYNENSEQDTFVRFSLIDKTHLDNAISEAEDKFPGIDEEMYTEESIKEYKDAIKVLERTEPLPTHQELNKAIEELNKLEPKLKPVGETEVTPNGYLTGIDDVGTYKVKTEPDGEEYTVTIDENGNYKVTNPGGQVIITGTQPEEPGILMPEEWIGEKLVITKVSPTVGPVPGIVPSVPENNVDMVDTERTEGPYPIKPGGIDWNDTSITVDPAVVGQEYAVFDEDGALVQGWVKATGTKVVFGGLAPGKEYEVKTRKPGDGGKGTLPSEPKGIDVTTDTSTDGDVKEKVEEAKGNIYERAEKAKKAIDGNDNLTDEQKEVLIDKIDEEAKNAKEKIGTSTDSDDDHSLTEEEFDAIAELIEETGRAIGVIESKPNLTPDEKEELIENIRAPLTKNIKAINDAKEVDEVNGIKEKAIGEIDAKKALIEATSNAIGAIEKNPNLTPDEKKKLIENIKAPLTGNLKAIDGAQDAGEVESIRQLEGDKIDAKQEVIDRTSKAIKGIKDNDNLSDKEKLIKTLEAGLNDELDAIDDAKTPDEVDKVKKAALARTAAKDRYMEEYSNLDPKQRNYVTDEGIFATGLEAIAKEKDPTKLADDGETLVTAIQNLYKGALEQVKGSPLTDEEWENTRKNMNADGAQDAYKKDLTNVLYNKLTAKEKAEVDKFIKDHLTDGDDIITAITNYFRKNAVMTGEDPWNNFSQAQKDYINAFLSMHGYDDGFPGLLAEAKASSYTKLGSKLAQTGDNYINTILNIIILLSAGAMTYLVVQRRRRTN